MQGVAKMPCIILLQELVERYLSTRIGVKPNTKANYKFLGRQRRIYTFGRSDWYLKHMVTTRDMFWKIGIYEWEHNYKKKIDCWFFYKNNLDSGIESCIITLTEPTTPLIFHAQPGGIFLFMGCFMYQYPKQILTIEQQVQSYVDAGMIGFLGN